MEDYLRFRKMITPIIIQVVFWIAVVATVLAGLFTLTQNVVGGIALIILGPLAARVYSEILIVLFEINEALQDIRGRPRGMAPAAPTMPGGPAPA